MRVATGLRGLLEAALSYKNQIGQVILFSTIDYMRTRLGHVKILAYL